MKRLKLSNLMLVGAMMLGGVVLTRVAEGSLIEFTFGGQLEQVIGTPPSPWDGISVGSEFLVTMVFDSETPDLDNNPFRGFYEFLSLEVSVDGVSQAAATGEIVVNTGNPFLQRYVVDFFNFSNGESGSIGLVGAFALGSDALPTTLDLNDWPISHSFELGGGSILIGGQITTFSSQIVPVPGTLFPLSMMGMIALFRRKRSS